MRVHLHEKINGAGKTSHMDHRDVKEVKIDQEGFITITHVDTNEGSYTYKVEDFRNIRISKYD